MQLLESSTLYQSGILWCVYETNTTNCTICRTVTAWVKHWACTFAEHAKMLHHADYRDDMPDDIVWYCMHVALHGVR